MVWCHNFFPTPKYFFAVLDRFFGFFLIPKKRDNSLALDGTFFWQHSILRYFLGGCLSQSADSSRSHFLSTVQCCQSGKSVQLHSIIYKNMTWTLRCKKIETISEKNHNLIQIKYRN